MGVCSSRSAYGIDALLQGRVKVTLGDAGRRGSVGGGGVSKSISGLQLWAPRPDAKTGTPD